MFFLKLDLEWERTMENSEHSIVHEAAGSSPAEAGCGEDILDLVCTPFWLDSNNRQTEKASEAYQFNKTTCFDWVTGRLDYNESCASLRGLEA